MSHVRQQIRDYVAVLVTGYLHDRTGTAIFDRSGENIQPRNDNLPAGSVYKMRRYALDDAKLPAICVYTGDESSGMATIGTRTLRRVMNVVIEAYCKGASTSVQDTIDTMCVGIEEAIAGSFDLGGLAKSTVLTGTEVDINVQGEKSIASAKLVYAVEYYTSISDVGTAR